MKTLVVIPARYASTRFPGKPLALLAGKPVIEWVWDNVAKVDAIDHAIVATDDQRIVDAVSHFGGNAMLTSPHHRSGTDRCGEVLQRLLDEGHKFDVVINVQGDEPFVSTAQLQSLIDTFATPEVDIATLRTRIATTDELLSANNVKVVSDLRSNALYFSRQPIPYIRGRKAEEWLQAAEYYKHVGIYAFRSHVL
ncbi:MAG: 3-deoxy-manno-octulosonate cytidylyltransferase, partial [Bacteroidales bacterium]|nr:3-deoxy-manno-octulosonate cytidylyltransferase [Bacteroidales bacterium]